MKNAIFITLLLHAHFLAVSQMTTSAYHNAPNANLSEIQGFETFNQCKGKLNNYGAWFRSYRISELFPGGGQANFKVFYQAQNSKELKFVAHGMCRTEFRFSTTIKEPGIYWCKFWQKNGAQKMIIVDARTLDLKIQLAQISKNTKL